jgi:hypothetical protein
MEKGGMREEYKEVIPYTDLQIEREGKGETAKRRGGKLEE